MRLNGLTGVDGPREALFARTFTACIQALRAGLAATAAGDYGSVTAWQDDSERYRCELNRYRQIIEQADFRTAKEAARWFADRLPWLKHGPQTPAPGPSTPQSKRKGKGNRP